MRPLLPLLLLPLLGACAAGPAPSGVLPGLFGGPPAEPEAPPPLPASVAAALPPGVPASIVLQDAQGCYLYSVERTDPPSGFPLRDALGNQICEGGPAPVLVADTGPMPPPTAVAPEPAAVVASPPVTPQPVTPPPAPIAPPAAPPVTAGAVTTAPLAADPATPPDDDAAEGSTDAPAAPAAPVVGPFVPGDITPPAPIAPIE